MSTEPNERDFADELEIESAWKRVSQLEADIGEKDIIIRETSMLIRMLLRFCTDEKLVARIEDYLVRKGIQGSLLR